MSDRRSGVWVCAMRCVSRVLAVGVEAVDAELDFGEDAAGGIQLAVARGCLYHLRFVVEGPASGAVNGGIQNASHRQVPRRAARRIRV